MSYINITTVIMIQSWKCTLAHADTNTLVGAVT